MATPRSRSTTTLSALFEPLLGPDRLTSDPKLCATYSRDICFWDDAAVAELIIRPANAAQDAACLQASHGQPIAIYVRGGGMSYSKGYVPARQPAIVLDVSDLQAIRDINLTDGYVTAEAGCTWTAVVEALADSDAIVDFQPPFSGIYSTVGGAMSQNVPQGMDGVLALEVALMNGTVLTTGSSSRQGHSNPFFKDFGPNLTGLFLGDCGAFGVKTAASIRLRQRPPCQGYVSFAFESYADMAAAMVPLSRLDYISRRVGLDPYKSQNSVKVGFKEAIETLTAVGRQSLGAGARMAAAAATDFMAGVKWSLHLNLDAPNEAALGGALEQVRDIGSQRGREIPPVLPQAMAAKGFSVRGFLGPKGQRWVPSNGLFPISRAVEVSESVQAFFAGWRDEMQSHGMWESYMTNFGPGYFLCEPSFYWEDSVSDLHLAHLPAAEAARFAKLNANQPARAFAMRLRRALCQHFFELGAIHVQLGKHYPYRDMVEPTSWQTLTDLKRLFDPTNQLNPGNLGFSETTL
jgi:D-lactate dehydrogenase (cytochrome)